MQTLEIKIKNPNKVAPGRKLCEYGPVELLPHPVLFPASLPK